MEVFGNLIDTVIRIFKLEFTIYGYTFSWWDVFLWAFAAVVVIICVRRAFDV